MNNPERFENMVTISLDRYTELVETETRVKVAVERVLHDDFFDKEGILWILDTELSVEYAQELREKAEKERMECLIKHH